MARAVFGGLGGFSHTNRLFIKDLHLNTFPYSIKMINVESERGRTSEEIDACYTVVATTAVAVTWSGKDNPRP